MKTTKITPWTVVDEKIVRAGSHKRVKDITFELPDGRRDVFTINYVARPVVCVLAVTTDGQVILARQYRPGPGRILDELPGGGVEPGETNRAAIERELLEETGYRAASIVSLGFPLECAYADVKREAFLATGCTKVREQELDENEFIEIVTKPLPAFLAQLVAGDCTDPEVGWMGLHELGVLALSPGREDLFQRRD